MAASEDCEVFVVCAEIEEEISQLDDDEKAMFLEELGLKESGLEKLIRASYHLLGLISYLTAGEPKSVHGRSREERKRRRRQERSIRILNADLSVRKLSAMMTLWHVEHMPQRKKRSCKAGRKRICCAGRRYYAV